MNKLFLFLLFNFGLTTLHAAGLSTAGSIHLSSQAKNIPITVNENIKGSLQIFHHYGNNRDSIRGGFLLTNHSKKMEIIKYRLVFKDKIGVVAQTTGEIHLKPGATQRKKFGNIVVGNDDIRHIHTYEVKLGSNR